MKVIESSAEIYRQGPGIEGMLKHIERVGRLSYLSGDRTTEDSYVRFIRMLMDKGHWSVFEHGTVYLTIPKHDPASMIFLEPELNTPCHNKVIDAGELIYVTTNYRYLVQNDLVHLMDAFWEDDPKFHEKRITAHVVCSRTVSHQLVRHRDFSFMQESQRYVNYSKDRNGSGITYIIPYWAYKIRSEIGSYADPVTHESREYIFDLKNEELWEELIALNNTVKVRNAFWKHCEDMYLWNLSPEAGLLPEEARGCLCSDTKTELCITGFLDDWVKKPDENSKEKVGFFYLRSNMSAQGDVRVIAESLIKEFKKYGYYDYKR